MEKFEIYRSKHNDSHFVAIFAGSRHENAVGVRESENLVFLTETDEADPRIAFDPEEARPRIERDGFYAFAVKVAPRERHAET